MYWYLYLEKAKYLYLKTFQQVSVFKNISMYLDKWLVASIDSGLGLKNDLTCIGLCRKSCNKGRGNCRSQDAGQEKEYDIKVLGS